MIEVMGIPVPGETLMTYVGYLIYQGKLNYAASVAIIYSAICIGITIAYCLGKKLGHPFFIKFGPSFCMGQDKFEKAERWFVKYGYRLIFFAYLVPGVRNINGYCAGIMETPFVKFALPAFTGALFYIVTFTTLGRILGSQWDKYNQQINTYLIAGLILIIVGFIAYKICRR